MECLVAYNVVYY